MGVVSDAASQIRLYSLPKMNILGLKTTENPLVNPLVATHKEELYVLSTLTRWIRGSHRKETCPGDYRSDKKIVVYWNEKLFIENSHTLSVAYYLIIGYQCYQPGYQLYSYRWQHTNIFRITLENKWRTGSVKNLLRYNSNIFVLVICTIFIKLCFSFLCLSL